MTFEKEFIPENSLHYDEDFFDGGNGLIEICTKYDICYHDSNNPLRCYKKDRPCIRIFKMQN